MRHGRLLARDIATALLIAMPVCVLAALAWATRHPDHARVEAARDWPLLGSWIDSAVPHPSQEHARQDILPTSVETTTRYTNLHLWFDRNTEVFANVSDAEASSVLTAPTRLEVLEQQGDWLHVVGHVRGWIHYGADPIEAQDPPSQHRTVWVRPGDVLYDRSAGEAVDQATVIANLPVVATATDDWVEVVYRDRKLWLQAPEFTGGDPPLGSAVAPLLPMAAVPINPVRLDLARQAFTGEPVSSTSGPYSIVGDTPRVRSLAALCDRRMADSDMEFEALTGLVPRGSGRETLLVFNRRDDYRTFLAGAPRVSDHPGMTDPDGYSLPAEGFAATFLEDRSDAEVCAILVHEVAHLISRRALGPALPPWLAEGLATRLERRAGSIPNVGTGPALVRMEDDFYAGDLDQRYRLVAAAIDLLLTDERFADATRAFLAARAAGSPLPDGPGITAASYWSALLERVGIDEVDLWRQIESGP